MHAYDEMKAYVDFTEVDEERLRSFWPALKPHADGVIDHFYERILAFDGARRVLENEEQVQRLKRTLRIWLEEALNGPWDQAYFLRRERIGRRHVEVGLHSRYMFTAMSVVIQDVERVARNVLPADIAGAFCESLQRVLNLDLAIMTGTFVEGREKRQLTALQELLVAHLRTVVLLVDAAGEVTAATRPTSVLFGGEAVLGRKWTDAVPAALLEAGELVQRVQHARDTGRDISLPRVDVEDPEGVRSYRIHVVPLDHPLAAFLIQVEELTDAVALEGRLRRSESLAQLGSLSASVAHELRNPLAGISGALQVIGRALPEDAPYRPIMGKVEQEVHRLNALVTDLLAFARPGNVRLVTVDLAEAVGRAVELVRGDWPGVVFEVTGTGRACADANLLQQILLNLLQNAAQAVDGSGRVQLAISEARIVVADDGPGIPESKRDEIFQPFFTTKTRGTGLGLAISERSAHSMQGRLRLAPQSPLKGAAFSLELERVE